MKLKTNWQFKKSNGLKHMQHISQCFKNFYGFQIFFYIYPLNISLKFTVFSLNDCSLKLKNIIMVLARCLIFNFLQTVIFTTLFRRCPTLWKSTLKMTMVDVHNVVSTLIWRCPTSRCNINLTTTLKQRGNVCWATTTQFTPMYCCKLFNGQGTI